MASTIKQRLRRFNGTDYDTIHLETSESQIIADHTKYACSYMRTAESIVPDDDCAASNASCVQFRPSDNSIHGPIMMRWDVNIEKAPTTFSRLFRIKLTGPINGVLFAHGMYNYSQPTSVGIVESDADPSITGNVMYYNRIAGSHAYSPNNLLGGYNTYAYHTIWLNTGIEFTWQIYGSWEHSSINALRCTLIGFNGA